ncbi:putative YfiH protein [Firmicutes bacterium CAG:882]|jgi:YfiH family protein|nr:putative YfiH protein [Firmicutes bacterium CAG:882]
MNLKVNRLNASGTTYIEEKTVSDGDSEHVVPVIGFETYRNYTWLTHGFSTRYGGVSDGIYKSMNLSFSQGDDERRVLKNHGIMAKTMGVELADMVYSHQTHTTNVLRVTREHAGMGFTVTRNFHDVDGFVTDVPGLMLVTAYADCVPLYFADTRLHVIGLSHSGWRGTVNNMAQATVDKMSYEFGSRPCDIAAFIGPSICASCYEIGDDVARNFRDRYGAESEKILTKKEAASEDKYYLNLHAANRINMLNAGISPQNIHVTDICTCCNPELLFSHRASKGKRGGLCGYMMIN